MLEVPPGFLRLLAIEEEPLDSWHRVLHDDIVTVWRKKVGRWIKLDKKREVRADQIA